MAQGRDELVFEIVEKIGVLSTRNNGWSKELNRVKWNTADPKYDIRDWDENHQRMSKGVTLHDHEMQKVVSLMSNRAV